MNAVNHIVFGFCWLDILAAVILAAVAVYAYVRLSRLKNQKKELENMISGDAAQKAHMKNRKFINR